MSVYLREHDTAGLDISVMSPEAAMAATCARARAGEEGEDEEDGGGEGGGGLGGDLSAALQFPDP